MARHAEVCLSFDFDAMSVWLGAFLSTRPGAILCEEFGRAGTERAFGNERPGAEFHSAREQDV